MLWPGHPATNLFRWGDGTPKPTIALASSDPFTRGTVADVDSYNYADPS
jgi:hypothetical protein